MTAEDDRRVSRGGFLRALGAGAGVAALGNLGLAYATEDRARAEVIRDFTLDAGNAGFRLGKSRITTIAYNDVLPGLLIRAKRGEKLRVHVNNHLGEDTTVHWHGLPIPNRMDGVPGVTQAPISAGTSFLYEFKVPVSGTYWYHSHNEIQLDRGLYGPLILDEPNEPLSYDAEAILVLDDWRDIGKTHLSAAENRYYCDLESAVHPDADSGAFAPTQPARYPLHLINGRPPSSPTVVPIRKGEVIRLRLINAAGGTVYRFGIAGHRMRVTHTDGNPIVPVDVDTLDIGMAERYDVLVYGVNPGVWQMAGLVNGQGVRARAVLRYHGVRGANPPARSRPRALDGKLLNYTMMNAAPGVPIPSGTPDFTARLDLNNRFGSFWINWNGQTVDATKPIHIPLGAHVRFQVSNSGSTELHPIHLHGHAFKLSVGGRGSAYKDTAIVPAFQTVTYDWVADNPGTWMLHCHNLYHMLAGMMLLLRVK